MKQEKRFKLPENQAKALLRYREIFEKGVRQRNLRGDTTMYNAGILPLNLYVND